MKKLLLLAASLFPSIAEALPFILRQLSPEWRIYGQYGQSLNKLQNKEADNTRETIHRFTVGTDYFVIPDYVKIFTEFRQDQQKSDINNNFRHKRRERIAAVGVGIY